MAATPARRHHRLFIPRRTFRRITVPVRRSRARFVARLALLPAALILTAACAPRGTAAASPSPTTMQAPMQEHGMHMQPPPPFIEVDGQGEARIAPDRATITLSVHTKGERAAQVAAENARIQTRVLDTLRALGFTGPEVSTLSYNVAPNYEYGERGARQVGYVAQNSVRVRLTRLDRIGAVIDAALARGANGVEGVVFEATETTAAQREAVQQATSRARAEAEALAAALGGTLGELLEVTSVPDPTRPMADMRMRLQAAQVSNEATPITPGEIVVYAQVVARWRFVPNP
jgi:uncharacterized protein YggE